ncbi:ferric reductase like transmembrane component [Xylariaceae sp. FL0662B]|nr:ferric reductase like transmembrane component [Xylariaceae sp. FL0662B]
MRRHLIHSVLANGLIIVGTVGAASLEPRGAPCFEACEWTVRPIKFTDPAGLSPIPRVRSCQSHLALTSLYLCTAFYCTASERTAGLDALNVTCQTSVQLSIPPFSLIANYTADDISHVRRLQHSEWDDAVTFAEAVIASDQFFTLVFDTLYSWAYAYDRHILYGYAMALFWGVVVAIGLLNRAFITLSHVITNKRRDWRLIPLSDPREDSPLDDNGSHVLSYPPVWLKRYLTVPATFGYRTAQPFGWYTVPPRIQSATILAFVVMNIVFCAHGYHVFPGNIYFPKVFTQAWRYVSDRTGIISFANFPLIWLFGMRNNFLMWLTGWDFGTYNNFHRWVARVATVEAVIHSVGYTVLVFDRAGWDGFAQYWQIMWWTTGEIATIVMCLLLPLSLYWMRRNVYEAFLILHIVLSVVVLATMWGHISVFSGHYDRIIWICCFFWVLDRMTRALRTLSFNPMFWNTKAKATYDKDANIVRLSIPCTTSLYRPEPGTFYYLHFLNDVRFWESHPFTMSSLRTIRDSESVTDAPRSNYDIVEEETSLLPQSGDSQLIPEHSSPDKATSTMTFLIRPYDSSTRRLARAAAATWPRPASFRVIVEGPYGHQQPLHRFESILFIVGGSGIVVPLAYLEVLGRATSRTKRVHIVWAVREATLASSVLREDLCDAYDGFLSPSLDIYITTGDSSPLLAEELKNICVFHHRPEVQDVVVDSVREFGGQGSVAVVACGPSKMADDTRKAVVDMLGQGHMSIEYFEESFNW